MEVERLAVRDFALERQNETCRSSLSALGEKGESLLTAVNSNCTIMTYESFSSLKPK